MHQKSAAYIDICGCKSIIGFNYIICGFLVDDSIYSASDLANISNKVVLGSIPLLGNSLLQLKALWGESFKENVSMLTFREMLRSCRFEVENEMDSSKILLINSLSKGEGKTFFSMSLAYAFFMIKKRVLLIDGNFSDPRITKETETNYLLKMFLLVKIYLLKKGLTMKLLFWVIEGGC
jgi:hypothetical protein